MGRLACFSSPRTLLVLALLEPAPLTVAASFDTKYTFQHTCQPGYPLLYYPYSPTLSPRPCSSATRAVLSTSSSSLIASLTSTLGRPKHTITTPTSSELPVGLYHPQPSRISWSYTPYHRQ